MTQQQVIYWRSYLGPIAGHCCTGYLDIIIIIIISGDCARAGRGEEDMSLVFEEGTPIRITKEINVISIERLSCTGDSGRRERPWNIQQEGVREGESSVAYC